MLWLLSQSYLLHTYKEWRKVVKWKLNDWFDVYLACNENLKQIIFASANDQFETTYFDTQKRN